MASEGSVRRALIETDFLFGLRESDGRHPKVALALDAVKRGELRLTVLSSAVLEARAVLYSRGLSPARCEEAMSLIDSALAEGGVSEFMATRFSDVVVAEHLRRLHPGLGYFDSLHAAPAKRFGVPILGSEGVYGRIGVPFIDLDGFKPPKDGEPGVEAPAGKGSRNGP